MIAFLLRLAMVSALVSCGTSTVDKRYRQIAGLPQGQVELAMERYPPLEQLDIAVCALKRIPPNETLIFPLVRRHPELGPAVLLRAQNEGGQITATLLDALSEACLRQIDLRLTRSNLPLQLEHCSSRHCLDASARLAACLTNRM